MEFIQSVFNNREIAIAFWVIIVVTILIFTKVGKDFLKSVTPILFCKKFVIFYFVFISFLCLVIYGLYKIEIWSLKLVKDTIFWVMFVELPLFAKTIEEAKDARFFRKLIKDNIAISVAVEFLIGFWTFDLWVEILLIPFLVFISVLYAVAEREKKNKPAKSFLQGILTLLGVISFIYAIYNLVHFPQDFFSVDTLKVFVLPLILLILNLPVVYGLAIYNVYEQIFIHLKGTAREKRKMKVSLVLFAGINLHKLSMIRSNMHKTIIISLTNKELKDNLHKLQKELDSQIGDNYMKRSKFYVRVCIVALFVSVVGLIGVNAEVSIKDLFTFNFVLDIVRVKEIFTYIFSTMLVVTMALLVLAIGFKKKRYEEISQIKKFALYEVLTAVKRQEELLMEYPPIEDPVSLFTSYVYNAHEIKKVTTKVLVTYENLLTSWERETMESLQEKAILFLANFVSGDSEILPYNAETFKEYYEDKVRNAPQNEKINTFEYDVKRDLEQYVDQIKRFSRDFKSYY